MNINTCRDDLSHEYHSKTMKYALLSLPLVNSARLVEMRLLAVTSVLLVLVFFSSCVYHFHLVDSLRETEKECLTESRDKERTECLAEVEQSFAVKYYVEWVLFVSGISGFILVMVVVYLAWKDWQRRKDEYKKDLNAYRQQLDAKERMEAEFRSKVGHYKDDVENVVVEYQRGWQEAQREAAFLNMKIQRQHVKDRSNWAKITQLRKREGTLKKELEAKSKIEDELALENERLARELENERKVKEKEMEDSERLAKELLNERRGREREMEDLRQVVSEKERLERELSNERREREREMEDSRRVISEKERLARELSNERRERERELRNEPKSLFRKAGEFFRLM